MNVRNRFSERKRVSLKTTEPGKTKQAHKDECDINKIIRQYDRTGVLTHLNRRQPFYANVDGGDFREAMEIVTSANTMFEELPSALRKEFKNDPALFLDYVQDPQNEDRLVEWGLLAPEAAPEEAEPKTEPAPPAPAEKPGEGSSEPESGASE